MNFGEAKQAVKSGKTVARPGWDGQDVYIYPERTWVAPTRQYVPSSSAKADTQANNWRVVE